MQHNTSRISPLGRASIALAFAVWGSFPVQAWAAYTETMDMDGPSLNCRNRGLRHDGAETDQAGVLQAAVDELAAKGGGRLIIPNGTYAFTPVEIRSNVHVLIEKDTVIMPFLTDPPHAGRGVFTIGRGSGHADNVSIRGLGGRFTVDFRRDYNHASRVRAIIVGDVTNFLISDLNVQDCYTIFSAITISAPQTDRKGFVGAIDGTIRDCSIYHASNGYGLVQAHSAKSVLFENLYALGGVAMRLECGVRPDNPQQLGGVFDVLGRNVRCENGYVALLLGPHSTHCGVVRVDGIEAISCEFAVKLTGGFVSRNPKKAPKEGPEPGTFAKGTSIRNIRAVFGMDAQLSPKHLPYLPANLRRHVVNDYPKFLRGPSITGVLNHANYEVQIENLETEGFGEVRPLLTRDDALVDEETRALTRKYRELFRGR